MRDRVRVKTKKKSNECAVNFRIRAGHINCCLLIPLTKKEKGGGACKPNAKQTELRKEGVSKKLRRGTSTVVKWAAQNALAPVFLSLHTLYILPINVCFIIIIIIIIIITDIYERNKSYV